MADLNVNSIGDASGGNTATINSYTPTESNMAGRNRIINGEMRIDQRNAGASVTPTDGQYSVDRWACFASQASKYSIQQSSTAPAGFKNSVVVTSLSSYSSGSGDYFALQQTIEGYNVSDLGFGAVGASTVTISFWVRSSLTGTFGGSLKNKATSSDRSYPFTFTINSANTWEQKTVTIAGDTTGTWTTTNGNGLCVCFNLGTGTTYSGAAGSWAATNYLSATGATSVVGTNGATFYITGVQLEVGEVATPFERRSYGQELALCQRYYYRTADDGSTTNLMAVGVESSSSAAGGFPHPVSMRAAPTITLGSGIRFFSAATSTITPSISGNRSSTTTFAASFAISGATGGQAGSIFKGAANGFVEASSEL